MDTRFTVEESNLYCLTISLAVKPDCIFAWESRSEEQSVTLEGGQMAKLLRYIVHILEIFMWEQDYFLRPDERDYDPLFDGEEDFFMEDLKNGLEVQPTKETEGNPSWRVQVGYTNHTELIFAAMRIICQIVQKKCIFPCWNILSRRMRSFNGGKG